MALKGNHRLRSPEISFNIPDVGYPPKTKLQEGTLLMKKEVDEPPLGKMKGGRVHQDSNLFFSLQGETQLLIVGKEKEKGTKKKEGDVSGVSGTSTGIEAKRDFRRRRRTLIPEGGGPEKDQEKDVRVLNH